ncbi:MAG: hypothetical protein KC476_09555, partial [Cyanobacteria bacterium HKST-UBA06]|nr:hypothetical protein [Cyanobacteria bacterium HKST-UBA06]
AVGSSDGLFWAGRGQASARIDLWPGIGTAEAFGQASLAEVSKCRGDVDRPEPVCHASTFWWLIGTRTGDSHLNNQTATRAVSRRRASLC